MEVTFTNPVYLWALLAVPVLIVIYFISLKYSKARTLKFANFVALSRVSGGVGGDTNSLVLIIRMIALICVILSISGMTLWYIGESTNKDYVIALDASASMMSDDFDPTRLEAAKTAAINFVDNLPINSRIGILSFAGTSFVDQPLTYDKGLIKESISNINAKVVGGTDFGNAIITSTNILIPSKKARMIVLLTDGRSNIGISEEAAIAYAIDNHIIVHTIGIGRSSPEGELELGLDEESLKEIASVTLGIYYFADSSEDLIDVYDQIIQSKSVGNNPIDLSFILLLVALFLLIFDWTLGNTLYRVIP